MKTVTTVCVWLVAGTILISQQPKIGPPLADIGGRRLHFICAGGGSPPVVASSERLVSGHAALARLSTNSRSTVVPNARHEIHLFAPAAVIEAVRDVSTAAAQITQLPERP